MLENCAFNPSPGTRSEDLSRAALYGRPCPIPMHADAKLKISTSHAIRHKKCDSAETLRAATQKKPVTDMYICTYIQIERGRQYLKEFPVNGVLETAWVLKTFLLLLSCGATDYVT